MFLLIDGCSKLTDVTIPARVWAIHWRAFDDCASLTDIWCVASEPGEEWEEDFEWVYVKKGKDGAWLKGNSPESAFDFFKNISKSF